MAISKSYMIAVVKAIVERKDNKNAKIVFCHYRGEIDELRDRLIRNEMSVETFDGRTPQKQRKNIITSTTCDVLILQIQTGCEGLNLQRFSEIYFVSPHWNPAVEDQAVARCHRIGQQKETHVFRFNMVGFDLASADSEDIDDDEEIDDEDIDDDEEASFVQTTIEEYSISIQTAKREIMSSIPKE